MGNGVRRQALYFTAPRQMALREEELPPPGAGEVTVATLVSGISAGTEMLFYRDEVPPELAADATIAALSGPTGYPLKYGYAAVGRVIQLGSGVDRGWLGRLVFAFQPHQSHFTAPLTELQPLPAEVNPETAVLLPNMETAVSLLMDGRPLIGERVALFGQGVVGLLTTALLAGYPLASLTAVEPAEKRQALARRVGATAVVDPTAPDSRERLQTALGGPADLAYELSGNPQALDQAIAATGFDGRIVIGSWYGQKQAALNLGGPFHRSHIRLISSQVSQINPRWRGRWTHARRLDWAWEMLRRLRPSFLVTHRFELDQAPLAYQLLDEAGDTAVQVALIYPTGSD
jgi:2-desacetyl-2-hydroxyethyl bacteriochlorophyllide A dehydrogenase